MKNRLVSFAAVLALMACGKADTASDTKKSVPEAKPAVEMPTSITLPAFPELPAPSLKLETGQAGDIYFATKSPYDYSVLLNGYDEAPQNTGKGHLVLPDGAGPENRVPAMIILPGSGGEQPGREMEYAKLFAKNGIASLIIDYYSPRGATPETPYMIKTLSASEVDVLTDAYNALLLLSRHPDIDDSRIGLTGYSYGGMATRYAIDSDTRNILAPYAMPFALHISVYGPCHQTLGEGETTGAPYLAIYGDKDNSVDPAACDIVHADLKANGSEVESHTMPGAGHAWETKRPLKESPSPYIRGCTFSYDQETGAFELNDKPRPLPSADMSREERALARTQMGPDGMKCVGQGYLMGHDPETDDMAKALMLDFMKRKFELNSE